MIELNVFFAKNTELSDNNLGNIIYWISVNKGDQVNPMNEMNNNISVQYYFTLCEHIFSEMTHGSWHYTHDA